MIRAFLAIEVPEEYRRGLAAVQEALKKSGADVKWVTPGNIHLTLKFFGDVTPAQIEAIAAAAGQVAAATPCLELRADGMGTFPGPKNPRVIWLGLTGQTDALANLVQELEQAFAALGFPPENRPFTPHLTLGRVRSSRGREALCGLIQSLALPPFQVFTVTQMVLFQSTLRPSGALYTPLQKITFRQGT